MKRLFTTMLLIGAMGLATWTADRTITFAADEGGGDAALKADTALQVALKKKDVKAAGALLDQQFSWTTDGGQALTSAQFLKDAAAGTAVGDTEYNNVKAHDYGDLAIVTGVGKRTGHEGTYFCRVWVKRAAGWVLLSHQDTPIMAKGSPSQPTAEAKNAASSAVCDNPCRTLPFTPKTAEQKDVVKAYEAIEVAVDSHDERTWAYHVADEFVGIGRRYTGTPDTKGQRVGQIGVSKAKLVLPKMLWGEAFVFGDAGAIIAEHQPVGEPPFRVIRLFVKRDGRWQLFHRQETTIKGTPPARDKAN